MLNVPVSHISIVLDRSGSMKCIRDDVVNGFNEFVADQKQVPGEARLSLFQFDSEYEIVHDGLPLADVPEMQREDFQPRASTALLDAIGRAIADTQRAIEVASPRPERVLIAIITDGYENSSREFDHRTISDLIRRFESEYGWEFVYLAADQDAIATAAEYGIKARSSMDFCSDSAGTEAMWQSLSDSTARHRRSGRSDESGFFGKNDPDDRKQ